jgi:hypothetical protein
MKRLMDSISDNPLGKTINRWVGGQSAPDGAPGPKGPLPDSH